MLLSTQLVLGACFCRVLHRCPAFIMGGSPVALPPGTPFLPAGRVREIVGWSGDCVNGVQLVYDVQGVAVRGPKHLGEHGLYRQSSLVLDVAAGEVSEPAPAGSVFFMSLVGAMAVLYSGVLEDKNVLKRRWVTRAALQANFVVVGVVGRPFTSISLLRVFGLLPG